MDACSWCPRPPAFGAPGPPDGPPADEPLAAEPAAAGGSFAPPAPGAIPAPAGGGLAALIVGGARAAPREPKASDQELANRLTTDTCECAETVKRRAGEPCSTPEVLSAITAFVQATGAESGAAGAASPESGAVQAAAAALNCTSEACVVAHPDFRAHAAEDGLRPETLDAELVSRFKPEGPRSSCALLSNFNLDAVLQQWAVQFPTFYNFPFAMADFDRTGEALATTDIAGVLRGDAPQLLPGGEVVRRPCETFGCAFNTDVSTGKGKHWEALFGDCRGQGPWSVEFFNSAGNPPPPSVTRWMETTAMRLAAFRLQDPAGRGDAPVHTRVLSDVRHQESQTECGLYVLYFLRARLEGRPADEFTGAIIPDEAMRLFRQHVFRPEK